jgi:solute carrier family 25 (mitochondrial citrate transporter), member 1
MMPTVAIKNALQEGRPVPNTVFALYRGLGVNIGSMLPIVACQFGMNRYLDDAYRRIVGEAPSTAGSVAIAMGAGATSGFIGAPSEYIVIQQQKYGGTMGQEFKRAVAARGIFAIYKGLVSEKMHGNYKKEA